MNDAADDSSDDENNRYTQLDPEEGWDAELADDLVGSTLYVGLTFVDPAGTLLRRKQVFGTVESVSITAGIKILQVSGETFTMAPVLDAIGPGDPDLYQFTDADEVIENPDFVAWITAIEPLRS